MKKVNKNQTAIPGVGDFISLIRQQSVLKSSRLLDHETFLRTFKGKETSDAELIEEYNVNHNEWAFEELYSRYKSRMLAYLYGILHSWEDAKDVLHDAWEVVLQSFSNNRYREEQDFACWFKGICYRKARDWQRERRRFVYGSEQLPDHADASLNAEERLVSEQNENMLTKAVDCLDEKGRQLVLLRAREGKSFYEISVIMNIKMNVARALYSRAVKDIKRLAGI